MEIENLLTFNDRRQLREWFELNHLSEKMLLGSLQQVEDGKAQHASLP